MMDPVAPSTDSRIKGFKIGPLKSLLRKHAKAKHNSLVTGSFIWVGRVG